MKHALETQADIRVTGEAGHIAEARELLRAHAYDVVVLDISLPDGSGFDLMTWMRDERVHGRVIVMSMHQSAEFIRQAFRLGASAFLSKGAPEDELHAALRTVADGGVYAGAGVAAALLGGDRPNPQRPLDRLTPREVEVAFVLSRGATTVEAADELGVSPKTVEAHRANIYRKLQIRNVAQLTRIVTESEAAVRVPGPDDTRP
jgi:DNA-binding NarL/FixJ family response regulator